MLKLNTIDPPLFEVLLDLSRMPELANFALVGGTALSLQLGHRKSNDLDFFTDRSFDLIEVKAAIEKYYPDVHFINETKLGFSFNLPMPGNNDDIRKLDIYNWAVKFIRPIKTVDEVRLASLEDISAFKFDAVCHRKEKKDYVDIAFLLRHFTFQQMIGFYAEKFPMNDKRIILTQILDTEGFEMSVDPVMLENMDSTEAFSIIEKHVRSFAANQITAKDQELKSRDEKITDILNRGKKMK